VLVVTGRVATRRSVRRVGTREITEENMDESGSGVDAGARSLAVGRYTLDNIAPACRPCNTGKCNDEVTSWMRRKRLDERTFLLRHLQIQADVRMVIPAEPEDDPGLD
jgi:hypothetical protein